MEIKLFKVCLAQGQFLKRMNNKFKTRYNFKKASREAQFLKILKSEIKKGKYKLKNLFQ
jgi:hypothetical protein